MLNPHWSADGQVGEVGYSSPAGIYKLSANIAAYLANKATA